MISSPKSKKVNKYIVVRSAKASSAPGLNEVLYRLYKSAPDALHFFFETAEGSVG